VDTASYVGSAQAVWVVLANDDPERNGDAQGDRLISVENLVGSDHDDVLHGDDGANLIKGGRGTDFLTAGDGNDRLEGGEGADTLVGGEGADRLFGGAGADWLTGVSGKDELAGGGGADLFVFGGSGESGPASATRDLVKDFSRSQGDKLLFKSYEFEGDWTFVGKAAFDGSEQARYRHADGKTIVELNADADASPELTVALVGTINLTSDDFLFAA
jgi:Ca2+-binding RTX toxin-like protein